MGDKKGAQPGNQNARKAEVENEGDESKNVTFDSDRGNAATYRVAKLKRDHPEVAERMKAGEFKNVAEGENESSESKNATFDIGRGATYRVAKLKRDHGPKLDRAAESSAEGSDLKSDPYTNERRLLLLARVELAVAADERIEVPNLGN